jgi:hypothetical protein
VRVPRQLVIGGELWTVSLTDDVDECGDFDDVLDGACVYTHREIRIDRDLSPEDRAATLLHEILHAALPHWSEARVAECEAALWPVLVQGLWRRR